MKQDSSEPAASGRGRQERLPSFLDGVIAAYPEVWRAYRQLGNAAGKAGPLDARAQRLVKLALAVGARSQGAVHSHARRGLREGIPAEELLQVPLLAITSIGWSAAMAALAWVRDVIESADSHTPEPGGR